MNKFWSLFPVLGFFAVAQPSWGDGLVNFPTGLAKWTIDVTPSNLGLKVAPQANGRITTIEVTQDDQKNYTVATWSSGSTTERWMYGGMLLSEGPTGYVAIIHNNALNATVLPMPFVIPSDFSWITPQCRQGTGTVSYNGKDCFDYKGEVPQSAELTIPGHKPPPPTPMEAWIDSKTLLPVGLDNGTALGTFTFQKPPETPLVFPAKFQAAIAHYVRYEGPLPVTR